MIEDIFKNNPELLGMSPEKIEFIKAFANMDKPKNMNQAMPFLIAQMNQAKKKNINFSKPEVAFICEILSQNLPPEEKERVRKLLQIMGK